MFDFNHWLNRFPGTNFHELNIDWIVQAIKELTLEVHGWKAANEIHYAGHWDITKQYTAWSVVVDDTEGYISLQPVPAGIDITNTTYWESIANFTALIGDLNDRVDLLAANVDAVNSELRTVENLISPIWSNRKVLFLGDSYGRGLSIMSGQAIYVNGWPYYAAEKLGITNYDNLSVNQASFAPDSTENHRYGMQLKNYKDNHTQAQCEAVSDIVICGGFNEVYYRYTDILNTNADYCAKWVRNYVDQYFPNARVFIGFIGRVPKMSTVSEATIPAFNECIQKYKDVASRYGFIYLNGLEYASHDYTELSEDGVHWLQSGYKIIGDAVAEALNNGCYLIEGGNGKNVVIHPNASSDTDHIKITTSENLYNIMTGSGVHVFAVPNSGPTKFLFNETTLNLSDHPYNLGQYIHTNTQTFNRFSCPQYGLRIEGYAALLDGSNNVTGNLNASLIFDTSGNVIFSPESGRNDLASVTVAKIFFTFTGTTIPYSYC